MDVTTGTIALVVGLGLGLGSSSGPMSLAAQASTQATTERVDVFKIEGMTCSGCAVAVKMAAKSVDGVKECKVSYENGTAEVTYDRSKTTPETIAKVISDKSGFKATAPKKTAS